MLLQQGIYLGQIVERHENFVHIEMSDENGELESRDFPVEFASELKTDYCVIRLLQQPGAFVVCVEDSEYSKKYWEGLREGLRKDFSELAIKWQNSKLFDEYVESNKESMRQFEMEKLQSKYMGDGGGY